MKWSLSLIVVLLSVVGLPEPSRAQDDGEPIIIGERHAMHSEILNEERRFLVGKPSSYDGGADAYPVLYVLDGDTHFLHTSAAVRFLAANDRMPEMIVVAVPNTTDRTRDLTPPSDNAFEKQNAPTHGGADTFLRFLSDELMPWINSHYRTRPYSVLVGHSFGGLFSVHTLLTRSDVFDAYLAISPSLQWNDQALIDQAEAFFRKTPQLTADLYMTVGNEGGAMLGSVRKLAGVLDEHAPTGFRWGFRLMEDETHGSVPLRSTRQGLESIFDGWNLHDPMPVYEQGGLTALNGYYRRGRGRFGDAQDAPPSVMNVVLGELFNAGRLDEAAEVLLRDPEQFPPPANLLFGLGTGYEAQGNEEEARNYYTRALRANPGHEQAKEKLVAMGVDIAVVAPPVEVPMELLERYAGQYQTTDWVASIGVEDGQLTTQGTDYPKTILIPVSENAFYSDVYDAQFTFNRNAAGEIDSMTIFQFGQTQEARRID